MPHKLEHPPLLFLLYLFTLSFVLAGEAYGNTDRILQISSSDNIYDLAP